MEKLRRDMQSLSRYMWTEDVQETVYHGLLDRGEGEANGGGSRSKPKKKQKNDLDKTDGVGTISDDILRE